MRKRVCSDELQHQLVVPRKYCETALDYVHSRMGHLGRDRTLELLRERYYWPSMQQSVVEFITRCGRCVRRKDAKPQCAPLVSTETTQPMELVCIDFLKLEKSKGGIENVLVITDHFTKYAQAYPTTNQTAKTTAKTLFEKFFVHYGFPKRIHSDQGRNFESKLIESLCSITGVHKSRTTPYHPMGNGIAERFNSTLINMLGTLEPDQKVDWKSHIGAMVHAYNCTKHDTTGFSPYYLMFGRHPRIAVDLALGRCEVGENTGYVKELQERLKKAYELAEKSSRANQGKQKKFYDRKVRSAVLASGDRVLIKTVGLKGMQKLADRWSEVVYVVVDQPHSDIPVYRVRPETGRGGHKTLHRNLLLPVQNLPVSTQVPKPVPHRTIQPQADINPVDTESSVSSDSDDENSEWGYMICRKKTRESSVSETVREPSEEKGLTEPVDDQTFTSQGQESTLDSDVDLSEDSYTSQYPESVGAVGEGQEEVNVSDHSPDRSLSSSLGEALALPSPVPHRNDVSGSVQIKVDNLPVPTPRRRVSVEATRGEVGTRQEPTQKLELSGENSTPEPAPRRSNRIRTQGHLRPEYVYDFAQTNASDQSDVRDIEMQKIRLLPNMIGILK